MASAQRRRGLLALATAGLLLAACGGSGKSSARDTSSTSGGSGSETTLAAPDGDGTTTTLSSTGGTAVSTVTGGGARATTTTTRKGSTTPTVRGATTTTTVHQNSPLVIPPGTAPPSTQPTEKPQTGGTLTVLMPSESNGFDPTKGTGSAQGGDMQRMFAVYDALVYQDPATGSIVPELAQAMTSPDAKTWTIKIRSGVKFSDGTAYDAAAVKFNWDRHGDPANSSPWAATIKTLSYQVVDPLTLQVVLAKPSAQFPRVVSRQLSYIASPTALQVAGAPTTYNTSKPVGAGPFLLVTWARDSQMVLVRNPNYWNAPRPYVDSLVFKVSTDETQREATLRSGGADSSLTANPLVAQDLAKTFTVYNSPMVTTMGFGMNQSRPPFNDKNVRKAVQLAIDVDQYNKIVTNNALETPRQMFPSNYPYADPTLTYPLPDLVAAQKLIDAYTADKGDIAFTYTYVNGTPAADQAAQFIQAQVQRLNRVKVTLKGESVNQYVADLVQQNFDASTFSYYGVDPEPDWSEAVITNGSRNFFGYSNPAVDQAVAEARTTMDPAVRNQNLKTAQKALIDDMLFVPLNRSAAFFASRSAVKDVATFDDGGLLSDRVWIKSH